MNSTLKNFIERTLKCKIYRNSLPRGIDVFSDIERTYGLRNFRQVMDVGANVGQSAALYCEKFPEAQIHSFEPVQSTFKQLQEKSQSLGNRVSCHHKAVGDENGEVMINVGDNSEINSIKYNHSSQKERVEAITVDSFIETQPLDFVDFLKIDTEGFEIEVLNGCNQSLASKMIGILYIESGPVKSDRHFVPISKIIETLKEHDYELFGVYEQQQFWTGEKQIMFFNLAFISPALKNPHISPQNYSNVKQSG